MRLLSAPFFVLLAASVVLIPLATMSPAVAALPTGGGGNASALTDAADISDSNGGDDDGDRVPPLSEQIHLDFACAGGITGWCIITWIGSITLGVILICVCCVLCNVIGCACMLCDAIFFCC